MPDTSSLDPRFRPYADYILAVAREYLDTSFRVTSARRDRAEQARLYERYKMGLSPLPANPPGKSWHEWGLAFDIARAGFDPKDDPVLQELGEWWSSIGGLWSPKDPVHFQLDYAEGQLAVPDSWLV